MFGSKLSLNCMWGLLYLQEWPSIYKFSFAICCCCPLCQEGPDWNNSCHCPFTGDGRLSLEYQCNLRNCLKIYVPIALRPYLQRGLKAIWKIPSVFIPS